MSDHKRLALELFHAARRERQILDKLHDAISRHRRDLEDIGYHLCVYARWQRGDLLVNIHDEVPILWRVYGISFVNPGIMDMKPEFIYTVQRITYKIYDEVGEDRLIINPGECNHYTDIGPGSQQFFRTATKEEIEAVTAKLPRQRRQSGHTRKDRNKK
jgi:hypothetical protein